MHGVDLEISPIERAIGIVMVDFAGAARVLGALNGQGNPTVRAELVAGVLLVSGETMAELIRLGFGSLGVGASFRNDDRPLDVQAQGRLERERIARLQHRSGNAGQNGQEYKQAREPYPPQSGTPAAGSLGPRFL